MTSVEFLKLCVRRWYVLLLGLVLTGALSWQAAGPNVVYFARTTVNVLEPDQGHVRIVGFNDPDTIAVANILVARVNNGVKTPLASSPDVDLYAMGIRSGTHAQIRNVGGQWLSQVTEPVVEIQSVGATPQQVTSQMNAEVGKVRSTLLALENGLKVPAGDRIELQLNPTTPVVSQQVSSHSRALLAYGMAGLMTTLAAVYWFDRLARSRTRGRSTRRRRTA